MIYVIATLLAAFVIWMVFDAKYQANLIDALKTGKFGIFSLARLYSVGEATVAIDDQNLQLGFLRTQVLHKNSMGVLVVLERSFICKKDLLKRLVVKRGKKVSTVEFYFSEKIPELNIQNYVWCVGSPKEIANLTASEFKQVEYDEIDDPMGI